MGKKYISFANEDEIINKIHENKSYVEKLLLNKMSLQNIINTAIGSNTYRIFKSNGLIKPSDLFRKWAFSQLGKNDDVKTKLCVKTKEDFDLSIDFLCNNLTELWNKELTGMTIFRSRKMLSLLLKNFCFWNEFNDEELKTYINRIPLPFDSKTLSAIRLPYNRVGRYKIPTAPTMAFVDDDDKYVELQKYVQSLADRAEVPVIYLDYLYFDFFD